MSHRTSILVVTLAVFGALTTRTTASAQGATRAEMQRLVAAVCATTNAKLSQQGNRGMGGTRAVTCVPEQSQAPQGAWRIQVPAVCQGEAYYLGTGGTRPVMSFRNPAIIESFGSTVRYTFATQQYSAQEAPFVLKELDGRDRSLAKEFKDVQVQFMPYNGAHVLVATIPVGNRLDGDDLVKKLNWYVSQGYFIACDVYTGHERARMANWDRLKNTQLARVTNDEFVLLNPVLQEGNYLVTGNSNYWRMRWDDYSVGLVNRDTSATLGLLVALPSNANTAKMAAADSAVARWARSNMFKGMTMLPQYDAGSSRYWLQTELPYRTLTGRQLMDTVKDFYSDYAKDKQKKLREILEESLR
jgi:hypothetical protein